MDRRQFLGCAGGFGLAAALAARPADAGLSCIAVHSAKSRCTAGIGQTPPIDPQPCRALAWATCLAYMIRGYGAKIDEDTVLAHYERENHCGEQSRAQGSNDSALLLAAAGEWRDDYGRRFLVRTERLPDLAAGYFPVEDARRILTRLSRQPVLCGAAGHTTLLTKLVFDDGAFTRLKVTDATVRDPWTGSAGLRPLSAEEIATPFPLIALSIRAL